MKFVSILQEIRSGSHAANAEENNFIHQEMYTSSSRNAAALKKIISIFQWNDFACQQRAGEHAESFKVE